MADKKYDDSEITDITPGFHVIREYDRLGREARAAAAAHKAAGERIKTFFGMLDGKTAGAVGDHVVVAYEPTSTFNTAEFAGAHPDLAEAFTQVQVTVDAIGLDKLRREHPGIYNSHIREISRREVLDVDALRESRPTLWGKFRGRRLTVKPKGIEAAMRGMGQL